MFMYCRYCPMQLRQEMTQALGHVIPISTTELIMEDQETCYLCGLPTEPFEHRLHRYCVILDDYKSELSNNSHTDMDSVVY